jgi:DNA-directed RNA polymerase subunit RPC12/RpoP
MYVVVRCPRCRGLVLGNTMYRTRACSHCGHRLVLTGMKVIGRTESSIGAVELIQTLKKSDVTGEDPKFKDYDR